MTAFRTFFVVAGLGLATVPSQQLPEGIQQQTQVLPPAAGTVLSTPSGLVAFDGYDLVLTVPGQPSQSLLHFTTPVFGSFTIAAGPGQVLFGESSTHRVWLVPLQGPPPAHAVARVTFNYDAVLLVPNRALVSAKTGGFATPGNELVVIDLASGATQVVAQLPGASGPLALAANGDLYYATASLAFPPPPGASTVLRFRRPVLDQAVAQAQVLSIVNAEVVYAGLDAASDLAFDDDGDLFFVDWWNSRVGELNDVDGPQVSLGNALIDYATMPFSASTLQFLPAGTGGVFEPFQPAGGSMLVHETDFWSVSQLRTLRSLRPSLLVIAPTPVPSGNFSLVATAGPKNGIGVVALATSGIPGETALTVPGFEQPLVLSQALFGYPILLTVAFDAQGALSLPVWNPGFSPILLATTQVAILSTNGVLGSSNPVMLQLSQ